MNNKYEMFKCRSQAPGLCVRCMGERKKGALRCVTVLLWTIFAKITSLTKVRQVLLGVWFCVPSFTALGNFREQQQA